MTRYQPGEIVNVTIKGAKVVKDDGYELTVSYNVGAEEDFTRRIVLTSDGQGVTVERVAPAEWPPQPGDLWADGNDREWFCRRHECSDLDCAAEVELVDDRGTRCHDLLPVPVLLAPLTLIRRKPSAVAS